MERLKSIGGKVFAALGTLVLLIPNWKFLQELDLESIQNGIYMIGGGLIFLITAFIRANKKPVPPTAEENEMEQFEKAVNTG